MMARVCSLIVFSLVLSAFPASACVTSFQSASHTINLGQVRVDAFGLVVREDRASTPLRLASDLDETSGGARCASRLRLTPTAGFDAQLTNAEGLKLPVEFLVEANPGQPSALAPGALEFLLASPASLLDAEVRSGGATTSGLFSGTFRLELMSDAQSNPMDESELTVLASVPPAVSLRFDDPRGPAHKVLDFGVLTPGARRSAELHVSATTPYALSVISEGGGSLVNRTAGSRADLPYELQINGRTLPVASEPTSIPSQQARFGGLSSESLGIEVIIGEVAGYAGRYTDVLTFTVSSVE
jgi:hypothetical protein